MIAIIAAMSQNRVIGSNGKLPWKVGGDLRKFKEITTGHSVIMGRKTYESIGYPLPGRHNIVLSKNLSYVHINKSTGVKIGIHIAKSLTEAIKIGQYYKKDIFIIGGGSVFKEALPSVDTIYLTTMLVYLNGDVRFPNLNNRWKQVAYKKDHTSKNDSLDVAYTFEIFKK